MARMIFINLPVTDLPRSIAFYEAVGGVKNPQFSNDAAAMMVLSDTIHIMLLTQKFFATFTPKRIVDAHDGAQVLLCLSEDSRDGVDALVDRAAGAGGALDPTPTQDHGFMYGRSFEDPDGHIWEVMWMDIAAMPTAEAAIAEAA